MRVYSADMQSLDGAPKLRRRGTVRRRSGDPRGTAVRYAIRSTIHYTKSQLPVCIKGNSSTVVTRRRPPHFLPLGVPADTWSTCRRSRRGSGSPSSRLQGWTSPTSTAHCCPAEAHGRMRPALGGKGAACTPSRLATGKCSTAELACRAVDLNCFAFRIRHCRPAPDTAGRQGGRLRPIETRTTDKS